MLFTMLLVAQLVIGLPVSHDDQFIDDLKIALNEYKYTETYEAGQFDCIDTVAITQKILSEKGYNPKMIMRVVEKGEPGESHIWLAVPDSHGSYAFVETTIFAFGDYGLGGIVSPPDDEAYRSGILVEDHNQMVKEFGRVPKLLAYVKAS